MKRKDIIAAGLAAALVLGATLAPAAAYLTGNDEAQGRVPVGPLTSVVRIDEDVEQLKKSITLTNEKNDPDNPDAVSGPVYVRMRAYTGPKYEKKLVYTRGDGWSDAADAEGWWYYGPILQDKESTTPFGVELVDLPEGTLLTEGDSVNIVIVYEYTPVLYDEAGNAYANWDLVLKVGGEA